MRGTPLLLLKMEQGTCTKEGRQLLDVRKAKEMDSVLEPPKGNKVLLPL